MKIQDQLDSWVAGKPIHNNERDECCPDFSCCQPELLAPLKTREAFARADDEARMQMLMGFMGGMLAHEGLDEKVHIVGNTLGVIQ